MINLPRLWKALSILSFIGFLDAAYLTITHFQNRVPPCNIGGCETVLTSEYSVIGGIPLALLGVIYYVVVFFLVQTRNHRWLFALVSAGFAISIALLGLQLFVINALCLYCLVSLGITTLLFVMSLVLLRTWRQTGNFI